MAEKAITEAEAATTDAERRRAYGRGKEFAEKAVALLPKSANAHFARFACTGRLAQLDGLAVAGLKLVSLNAELDRILELDPNHTAALAARGGMLVKLPRLLGGDIAKGIEFLEKSVRLDADAIGKRLELAEAYHLDGRDDAAQAMAEEALRVAEGKQETSKIELCKEFMIQLRQSCARCSLALIGR